MKQSSFIGESSIDMECNCTSSVNCTKCNTKLCYCNDGKRNLVGHYNFIDNETDIQTKLCVKCYLEKINNILNV